MKRIIYLIVTVLLLFCLLSSMLNFQVAKANSSTESKLNNRNVASVSFESAGASNPIVDTSTKDLSPLVSSGTESLSLNSVTSWYWTSKTCINSVTQGDTNGDGQTEIVTGGSYYDGIRTVAQLVVWNSSSLMAEKITTWYWTGNTTINSVALGDVNGDGQAEIVTGGSYFDGSRQVAQLCVWNGLTLVLENVKTWYWTSNTAINSIALGDVDNDGQTEIVTGGYYNDGVRNVAQLVVWAGSNLAVDRLMGWYWTGNTVINSVAIRDVDNDGQVEVVTGGYYNDGVRNVAQLIEWNGLNLSVDRLAGWYWTGNTVINSVAVGDADNDGQTEVVTGGYYNDGVRNIAQLIEWNGATLAVDRLTGWYWTNNTVINSVAMGDVDGDGQTEIVTGGQFNDGTRDNTQLVIWSGLSLAAEYIKTWYWTGNTLVNSVAVGDINGDYSNEIVTGGAFYDGTRQNSQLSVWEVIYTPSYKVYGLDFSPYIKDTQNPNLGTVVSEAQIRSLMTAIKPYTSWVRTFGCTSGQEVEGRVAHELGLKVAVGAWLNSDLSANDKEISSLIAIGKAGQADMLIVGSEVLLRGDLTEAQLIAYINQVKAAVPGIPVATADVYGELLAHPAVIAAGDVVLPNIYPYWEGINVSYAVSLLNNRYQGIVAAAGAKPIIISETGWPSAGDQIGDAIPSPENAAYYFLNFESWAKAQGVASFYFEAFDEPWKITNNEGPQGPHWGIWDHNVILKPGMRAVFDGETIADNWSGNQLIGGPGNPAISFTYVPPYGSSDNLKGQITHVIPANCRVVVYIQVAGNWWIKPYSLSPLTIIQPDGSWVCDITTGGIDETATQIVAYLISATYSPPPQPSPDLEQNAFAKVQVARSP